jgi:hypothetical protein
LQKRCFFEEKIFFEVIIFIRDYRNKNSAKLSLQNFRRDKDMGF